MNTEKLFRFNPFNIKEWNDAEIKEQYTILESKLLFGDSPMELSNDIDVYANIAYLIGEMIARYYEKVSITESKLKVNIANTIYRERNDWMKSSSDKAPAMSYFENKANSMFLDEIQELAIMESNLKRFKYAYDSIELKGNALKKKLDSLKFDLLNR